MSQVANPDTSYPALQAGDVARLLVESSKLFARTVEQDKVFEVLETVIRRTMPCEGILVSSYDSLTGTIRCSYAWVGGERPDPTGFPPLTLSAQPGNGMQSEVIRSGEARLFGDVKKRVLEGKGRFYEVEPSGKLKDLPKGSSPPTSSALMAPIRLDDDVIGVIQVMSDEPGAFGEAHLTFVEGLAFQLAAAEKNAALVAQMQAEIQERRRAEKALREGEEEIHRLNAELEERVKERTADLERATAEMESFCYSVSHDLRQPLRGICGSASMLMYDHANELSAEAREHFQSMNAAAFRMSRLIDDLLNFSRLGRTPMVRRTVDLSALAARVEAAVRAKEEVKAEIKIQADLRAHADAEMLETALSNLLSNAIKFSAGHSQPRVEFGHDGTAFYVKDNGVGFDPQYVGKLFRPFERLHREEEYPGTGMGLANVKRIVERHGGKVWADGRPDQGATFYFTIG